MAEQGSINKERNQEMIAHHKDGKSYGEIGKLMGVTRNTVAGVIDRAKNMGHCFPITYRW